MGVDFRRIWVVFCSEYKKQLQNARFNSPEYVFRWNSWVPKKVGIVAWRAILERLPTRCSLSHRNIDVPSTLCPLCGDDQETAEHLFVTCGFAQHVWAGFGTMVQAPTGYVI
ncbi:putative reverse transcriptase zinc-binding domain-containing protein [Helianthus annuus]|uniref:Reverse transcriptase zinc-binding domain-containing protein n=1 Tax=Helianthus annuus TaxID=4232 RepID=A0A9K3H9F2_HELAN|nr:putative reverse transcriptase zinc-binding domain-containing protein [Helianthus annuus]KAJ0848424.1 putative reverse transcriptase zinc-binding domain-containing protein [Helianthus annuus]